MKTNLIIRKTEPKDAEQHVRLGLSVWRCAYKNIFPEEVFIDKENKAEDKIKNFDKSIQNDNMSLSYVAESDGKIVGFVFGRMISHYEHFGKMGYADLEAIYIHPDYQGLGIGSKLKQIFIDWAKSNGATKFVIGVLKDNHNARKVYEKWGGKLDEYTQPFVKLGVGYDEVFYTYDLTKENKLKGEKKMIETERLILRNYRLDDLEDLIEGLNEFDVAKGLVTPFPYTAEDAKDFISKNLILGEGHKYNFAIVEKQTGQVIGGTGIEIKDGNIGGGGIWLNKNYQKKGYGTEVYLARTIFAFKYLGVNELKSCYYDYNIDSKHLHEKIGFISTGEEITTFNHALGHNVRGIIVHLTRERFEKLEIYKNFNIKVIKNDNII